MQFCFFCDWRENQFKPGYWSKSCADCRKEDIEPNPELQKRLANLTAIQAVVELLKAASPSCVEYKYITKAMVSAGFFRTKRQAEVSLSAAIGKWVLKGRIEKVGHGVYKYPATI